MASPFTIFRKHRKAFIAALTIMTMFGFVFIPMILDNMRVGRVRDPVMVATTRYGKLTLSQVNRMVEQRRRVAVVLQEARQAAVFREALSQFRARFGNLMDAGTLEAQAMRAAEQDARSWVAQRLGETNQESVVNSWLLARRAEDLGMHVTDETVNQFLKQTGKGRVGNEQWEKSLDRHGLSDKQFFALLRTELLGLRFGELFGPSVGAVTPAQRWDYFTRLKQEATIEAIPVRVAEYVRKVDDPDAKTLKAFFEEHKNDYDLPTLPTPGFRQPERVDVRYFHIVRSQIEKSISAAAVKEYVEKNKDSLERRYEAAHKKPEIEKPEDKKPGEKKTEEKKTEEKKIEEKKPEEKKTEEAKTGEKKPEEEKPAAKEEEKTTEEKKTEEKKTEEEKPEPKDPEADKTSARWDGAAFQFAAFLQETPEAEKTAEKTDVKTAEKTAEKPLEKPEDKPPAKTEEKPAEKSDTPVPEPIEGKEKPDAEKPAEPKSEPAKEKKPDVELEPLVPEVLQMSKQQWIDNAARKELADKQYADAVKGLQAEIKTWAEQQRGFEARTTTKAPAPLNFEALSAKYGATSDKTGLRSPVEMRELEIARSYDDRGQTFMGLVYADRSESNRAQLSEYQVGVAFYQGGTTKTLAMPETITYVFYKTEDRPEKFVAWDDEDTYKVALAKWKQVEARKLAFEAAEALAKKARGSEKTLKEIFSDRKVVSAGPFTWMTEGVAARLMGPSEPPTLSKVEGIERPGDDFMRTVFALSPGEVGVAMNRPETVAYVVRLEKLGRTDQSLWTSFELTPPAEYGNVAADDVQQMVRAWIEQLKADAGLKWEIPPDQPAAGESKPGRS